MRPSIPAEPISPSHSGPDPIPTHPHDRTPSRALPDPTQPHPAQAATSKIKPGANAALTFDEVYREILAPFIEQMQRRLLFLKAVETIEVYVWVEGEGRMKPICTARIVDPDAKLREQRASFVKTLRAEMAKHMPQLLETDSEAPPEELAGAVEDSAEPPKMQAYFKALDSFDFEDASILPRPLYYIQLEWMSWIEDSTKDKLVCTCHRAIL